MLDQYCEYKPINVRPNGSGSAVEWAGSRKLMTKWLKDSGLTVNEAKTEVCLFYARDHPVINLRVNCIQVRSKKSMNVLGVEFDSKL